MTQLPPTPSRLAPWQNTKRVRPSTYTAAVYILGAVLVFEMIMVFSIFWMRAIIVPVNFKVPKSDMAKAHHSLHPSQPAAQATPSGEVPNLAVSGRPALLALPGTNDKETQVGNLLDEAKLLRRQGDFKSALNVLIQAEDVDPRNPDVLQSMAETCYLLNDPVRSKLYWQRLVDLGPAVGRPYTLARDHVLLLNSSPDADTLESPSLLGRTVFIDTVEKTPVETLDGVPQIQVRTSLMRKAPNMLGFDQKKLQPYVIFYQQMADGTLQPDLRPHKGAFDDTFLFWNKKPKESFTVDYALPLTDAPGPDGKPMGKYYGFVIGIYYDKTLQDVRSEPADLITRLPLPDAIE